MLPSEYAAFWVMSVVRKVVCLFVAYGLMPWLHAPIFSSDVLFDVAEPSEI